MNFNKVVVIDAAGEFSRNNLLFSRQAVGNSRHGWAGCYLYEECLKAGIHLMTPDLYFASRSQIKKTILWRNTTINSVASEIIAAGVRPAILMAFEYPLYACDFYWNLKRHSAGYDHTLMPKGARPFVSPKTKFQTFLSPQPYPQTTKVTANFHNKKFLTMISSNGRLHPLRRLYATIANIFWPLPTLVNRELYLDRLEALTHFSQRPDFDFYGYYWERPIRFLGLQKQRRYREALQKCWRGSVDDKYPLLQNYKFSICFENCIFSGWITEKIIDSLLAGCVPVYWGAPDIEEFIPKDCFVDFRNFKNYSELEKFLNEIDEKTYDRYIKAINEFIVSDKYRAFTQEHYAETMIPLFQSYFE